MDIVEKIELTQEEKAIAEKFHNIINRNMDCFHKWWMPSDYSRNTSVNNELNSQVFEYAQKLTASVAQLVGYYGLTIVHQLVAHNYYDEVKLLLEKGINPDIKGAEGKGDYTESHIGVTPLHLACHAGNYRMVKLLLDFGADTTLCDAKGRNCFHFVASEYIRCVLDYSDSSEQDIVEQRIEIVKLLKCDINQRDSDGVTPLMYLTSNRGKKYAIALAELFIELGADAMETDNDGNTALIYAAQNEQVTATEILTKYPELINIQNKAGDTALNKTFLGGAYNPAAAYLLIQAGADINIKNNEGQSIADYIRENEEDEYFGLKRKCLTGKEYTISEYFDVIENFARDWWGGKYDDLSSFVHMIARKILRKIDKDDDTEMVYAIKLLEELIWGRDETCEAIQIFYEEGYDFCATICESSRVTTLRDICLKKVLDDKNILPKLKKIGVDIDISLAGGRTMANIIADTKVEQRLTTNIRRNNDDESDYDKFANLFDYFSVASIEELNNEGKAAIHYIAERDSFFAVEKMAERGVDINITTDAPSVAGNTPLHLACINQCVDTVRVLVELGADESMVNAEDETAAHSLFSHYDKFNSKTSYEIIKLLKNIDTPMPKTGMTPFMLMLKKDPGNVVEFTELFMEKGANLECADNKGNTPLLIHTERNCDRDVVKMMIKAGADINARNEEGNSVLYYVLKRGDCELARLLIKKGADYNVVNKEGKSPVDIAVEKGYEVVLELMTDIDVYAATSDEDIRIENNDGAMYRSHNNKDNARYDYDVDDDGRVLSEENPMYQYETMVSAYSQIYGPDKAVQLARLASRMGEINARGVTQDNMEEYTRLAEEFQEVLNS